MRTSLSDVFLTYEPRLTLGYVQATPSGLAGLAQLIRQCGSRTLAMKAQVETARVACSITIYDSPGKVRCSIAQAAEELRWTIDGRQEKRDLLALNVAGIVEANRYDVGWHCEPIPPPGDVLLDLSSIPIVFTMVTAFTYLD